MKRATRTRSGAPGIIDVANQAGVSPATVSRFFNSPDAVRVETRKRIQSAATELGYIRDRMAGAMHNRFSGTIGLVVPTINNTIFSELIDAFSSQLLSHDRTMLVASHNYDLTLEASIIRSLLERRIDGVAVIGHNHLNSAIDMLKVRSVPVVALWGHAANASIPFVGADNELAGFKVTDHLIKQGHKDIAFIFPDVTNNDRAHARKQGAMRAMQEANLTVGQNRVHDCPYDIAESKKTASRILEKNKPTAIVCANDVIAHGVIFAAQTQSLNLPQHLSVVGIGDFAGSADVVPSLTTVRLPAKRIGRLGADALVKMNEYGSEYTFANQLIETELIIRESSSHPVGGS